MGLQPQFQQGDLPEFGALKAGDVLARVGEQRIDVLLLKDTTVARCRAFQRIVDHVPDGPFDVFEGWYRKITLRAVNDFGRYDLAGDILEDAFAIVLEFVLWRNAAASSTSS